MEIMAAGVVLALVKIVKNMSQVKRLARGGVPKIKGKNQTHLSNKTCLGKIFSAIFDWPEQSIVQYSLKNKNDM